MEWTADISEGEWIRARLDSGAAWGETMHGLVPRGFAAYAQIPHREQVSSIDGREYTARVQGVLDPELVTAAVRRLAGTSTDDLFVAVWDGWGGLVGFFGETPSRAVLTVSSDDDPAVIENHRAMLERSIHDPFNNVFRKPVWQPGILPDEISKGGRLRLPQRDHILFRGGVGELLDPDWPARVPWAEERPEWTASPSLVWPKDAAWMLVTDVDADSTIVAGPVDLVRAICADPLLGALPLSEGADLSSDADEVDR